MQFYQNRGLKDGEKTGIVEPTCLKNVDSFVNVQMDLRRSFAEF